VNIRKYLHFFGSNGSDFSDSVVLVVLGFVTMFAVYPLQAYEGHGSSFEYRNTYILHIAGWFVFGFTAWLCAQNALRDRSRSSASKAIVSKWCVALFIWMCFLLGGIMMWYTNLHESMKEPWLQGG